MRALTLTDSGPRLRSDYPTPQPSPQEALIRVRLAGICATDLELTRGYKGGFRGVLGHEFVGEIMAVGKKVALGDAAASSTDSAPSAERWIGRRVVSDINIGCGACSLCTRGLGKHCPHRQTLGIINRDGAFAEYVTAPLANLYRVPDEVTDEQAVFTEPLAAALQILEQVHLTPSTRVIQLGDGRLGLLVAQALASTGCDLTVVGRSADKLAILAERGIDTRQVARDAAPDALDAFGQADVVVEATGSPSGFASARRLVRPGGTLVLKSTFASDLPRFDASGLVVDEITLVGSRCGPFAPALRLLRDGAVETAALIHARYSLEQGVEALEHAGRRGVLKVLIDVARCRTIPL